MGIIDRMRQRLQSGRIILRKKSLSPALALLFCLPHPALSQAETRPREIFRFHVPTEPVSLDPARLTSIDSSYFYINVMRGLFRFSNEGGLVPEGAKSCQFESKLRFSCRLAKDAFWNDGRRVEAEDYVRSFRRLVSSQSKNPSLELLKNLKNAMDIHAGKISAEKLGVRAASKDRLVFEFQKPDPDFPFKLTASILVPIRAGEFPERKDSAKVLVNGPYQIRSWSPGRRILLSPNPHYKNDKKSASGRPDVEILVIDDEQTALHLYESKQLSLLRRLPTTHISRYRDRPDFLQIPMTRFDYIGFGEELRNQPELRAALSHAADFRELQKIYDALGIPGCPSIPEDFLDHPRCVQFDPEKAKAHLSRVPEEIRKKRLKLMFSKLGGEDIKKGAEWFQGQWKKHLGLTVDLQQTEQGVFLHTLRTEPPAIFRKGVSLERPTCLAALETFAKGGSENFLRLDDPGYARLIERVEKLSQSEMKSIGQVRKKPSREWQKLCGEGIQYLLDRYLLIPLGRIHFTILADPKFQGWSINEMNQLDLSQLKVQAEKPSAD
jgi:oligopeptide transport system substrate-binding protein